MESNSPGMVFKVHELTQVIKETLELAFPSLWVEGEISNLARPASGHIYFTLKDESASLKAVVYRGVALRQKFDLKDGMHILVRGRISIYLPRGEYQILIEEVQPVGVGALDLAFRQRKEKLFLKGYFDSARKRSIPKFPHRIALVTSPTGSAVRDVLEILARRWPGLEVLLFPVRVQGEEAAGEIVTALERVNKFGGTDGPLPVDVVLLVRGGGSLEDLWPFNEEIVAHGIFHSKIPVLTGIGHEDDLTIADLVADKRALTPSEAAEKVVPDRMTYLDSMESLGTRLKASLLSRLEIARTRTEHLASRPCFSRPLDGIRDRERQVDELAQQLHRAMQNNMEFRKRRFQTALSLLHGLSPLKIMDRGYSLTRKMSDQSLITDVHQVNPGDWIQTVIRGGIIVSCVHSRMESHGQSEKNS